MDCLNLKGLMNRLLIFKEIFILKKKSELVVFPYKTIKNNKKEGHGHTVNEFIIIALPTIPK